MAGTLPDLYAERLSAGRLRPDPAQAAVIPQLEARRQWLAAGPERRRGLFGLFGRDDAAAPPRGLYLWGGVGRGKSMLMDLLVEVSPPAAVRRVHFHAFMQEVQAALTAARAKGLADALTPLAETLVARLRLLAFDEMQITDIADAMIVGRLFEKLFDAGVVIVTTSNRPPEDLYKDGLNRGLFLPFIALLRERMEVVELESPTDYRQHRLAGAQVWFQPAGAARGAMDALWADLTGGAPAAPLVLTVNGRRVELPRFASGVGRASFWELCARPLGPADYLAIAQAVRVLIVDDIPSLSAENYNEAKRFVILIDALYEARVRLVASAADAPERLYLEGAGSFEFARTASRLREMQGADWGR
jgi:cell division protein ZapE